MTSAVNETLNDGIVNPWDSGEGVGDGEYDKGVRNRFEDLTVSAGEDSHDLLDGSRPRGAENPETRWRLILRRHPCAALRKDSVMHAFSVLARRTIIGLHACRRVSTFDAKKSNPFRKPEEGAGVEASARAGVLVKFCTGRGAVEGVACRGCFCAEETALTGNGNGLTVDTASEKHRRATGVAANVHSTSGAGGAGSPLA